MTEGVSPHVGIQLDTFTCRDAPEVPVDVFPRAEPELRHGDEAAVHGLGLGGADAVVGGDVLNQLEVGGIVE